MTAAASDVGRAYDDLAEHYDALTAQHDYDAWTRDIEPLARAAGLRGRRLLDVACGTGKSFLPFLERGFEVAACDLSPAMVARAAAKAQGRARLSVHDMRALPRLGAFDLVTCLDDAANYLVTPAELTAALTGMRRNLAPGGLVVFDANTLAMYRTFFASLSVLPADDLVLVVDGAASPQLRPGGRAPVTIEALARTDDGGWRRVAHRHVQRHHPRATVRRALARAGLAVVSEHGMRLDGSIAEGFDELRNSKALYLARAR